MTGINDCPRVIATVGLHGSASTWVFNIVRELMIAAVGQAAVLSLYTDDGADLPDETARAGRHLIVKSHAGSPRLDDWLAREKAPIILSVRDPRDACVSVGKRFNTALESAIHNIAFDCAHVIRLAAEDHAVLRYENRFFEDAGTVVELAAWFGMQIPQATLIQIFDRYATGAVRSFVQNLADLPSERQGMVETVPADKTTLYLSGHIGDGRSQKWRDLPVSVQASLTGIFGPFLNQFHYPL